MRKAILLCSALLLLLAASLPAQQTNAVQPPAKSPDQPIHFYRLQFVVQEMNDQGKPTNSRTFTTTVSTDPQESARIRTGSRIPVVTGTSAPGADHAQANAQIQYVNANVNVDVQRVRESGHQLSLFIHAQVDSMAASDTLAASEMHFPLTRQNNWEANVLIPVSKPTVVFSSDTLEAKGSMQVVVTATPLP